MAPAAAGDAPGAGARGAESDKKARMKGFRPFSAAITTQRNRVGIDRHSREDRVSGVRCCWRIALPGPGPVGSNPTKKRESGGFRPFGAAAGASTVTTGRGG